MDIKEIQSLIKFVAKSGASEVKLEMEDIKITIRTGGSGSFQEPTYVQHLPVANPVQQQAVSQDQGLPAVEIAVKADAQTDSKYITIKSPIIGTFYRKPSPDKPVFVEVGDTISKGD